MNETEVVMSPLSKEFTEDGNTVQIDIYENGEGGWILEVTDEYRNTNLWDDHFDTDEDGNILYEDKNEYSSYLLSELVH